MKIKKYKFRISKQYAICVQYQYQDLQMKLSISA